MDPYPYCDDIECWQYKPCEDHEKPWRPNTVQIKERVLIKPWPRVVLPTEKIYIIGDVWTQTQNVLYDLHFDLNKTIVPFIDSVSGREKDAMLNSILSDIAMIIIGCSACGSIDCVENVKNTDKLDDPAVMTYGEYLENVKFAINEGDSEEEIDRKKKDRKKWKANFTHTFIGQKFAHYLPQLQLATRLPSNAVYTTDEAKTFFANGECFLAPSFLMFVRFLQAMNVRFLITFRTFGKELPRVATEFNLFCTGNHPLFPGHYADGTHGSKDLRFTTTMVVTRSGESDQHVDITRAPVCSRPTSHLTRVCGMIDDYKHWQKNNESDTSGKLLWVNQNPSNVYVFADDNIERRRAHIVDVRDADTGECLSFSKSKKYLLQASAFSAITDEHYFIDSVLTKVHEQRNSRV